MSAATTKAESRSGIYYWKCDRAAAFHGTAGTQDHAGLFATLAGVLDVHFKGQEVQLRPGPGQGNHATAIATVGGEDYFVRVEDGPEADDYMEMESHVIEQVRKLGVPTPRIHWVDARRRDVPFAWQLMDVVGAPDLNRFQKEGTLQVQEVAYEIGSAVARWQGLRSEGYGPFSVAALREEKKLRGLHVSYAEYFFLNLETHLQFLEARGFLPAAELQAIREEIEIHRSLLDLAEGCLVHKDLALWNILGTESSIISFIDWDDCISGDAMDDLSLLACFHHGDFISRALAGYASRRPLPEQFQRRFWLHLLRNMIVKAVIRVGAGYFDRTDGFFLIASGSGGADLASFTRHRMAEALAGLRHDLPLNHLSPHPDS